MCKTQSIDKDFLIIKVEDFWAYLEEELVPSLYQTKWYNEGTDPMVRCLSNKQHLISCQYLTTH